MTNRLNFMKKSALEFKAELQLKALGVTYTPEFRFHPERRWRFDFALQDEKIAIEIEGGIFIQGGHNRGVAYMDDCEKYNEAAMMGWMVLRYSVRTLEALTRDLTRIITERRQKGAWEEAKNETR